MQYHRRDILQGSLRLLGGAPLCCTTPVINPASYQHDNGRIVVDLKAVPELARAGSAAALVDNRFKLNLIVVRTGSREFAALDRSCTHGGAQCAYNARHRTIQCTSLNHAEYDLKGTLLHGRTHGNLRSYVVRQAGATLEIQLQA
jgi:nitrite reductase/ring-hydroxylating ferredoxin subunit